LQEYIEAFLGAHGFEGVAAEELSAGPGVDELFSLMDIKRYEREGLSLFGFIVDCVIVNRVMPEAAAKDYFAKWREIQTKHLSEIDERFSPLPIFHAKWFEQEVVGLKFLERMAQEIYGENDPIKIFHQEHPISMKKEGNEHLIFLSLPNTLKEELDVW